MILEIEENIKNVRNIQTEIPIRSNKINLKVNIMINYRTLKKQGNPLQLKEIISSIKKKRGLIKVYVNKY